MLSRKPPKPKKCAQCKEEFTPFQMGQKVCGPKCASDYARDQIHKQWKQEKRDWEKKNKTKSEARETAQRAVNGYIRIRDQGKPCISCGVIAPQRAGGTMEAGHFRSVGSAPSLRFHLLNIHLQCVRCNRDYSGNTVEYRKNLVEKYGEKRVSELEHDTTERKFTREYYERIAKIFNKRRRLYERKFR